MHACDPVGAIENEEIAKARETTGEEWVRVEVYSDTITGGKTFWKKTPTRTDTTSANTRAGLGIQANYHTFNKYWVVYVFVSSLE
jgi:hypothetical protein